MTKIYYGIDKDGIKRVWGVSREECKLAIQEYLAEKAKFWKLSARHMQLRIFEEEIDD
jgi:hypothetical protein